MGQSTILTTPQDQVNDLLQQVADENGLELQMDLPSAQQQLPAQQEKDALAERLAKLRSG